VKEFAGKGLDPATSEAYLPRLAEAWGFSGEASELHEDVPFTSMATPGQ
jgi:hypothetical protein